MSTIAVAGATGYLGRYLVQAAHARGHQIRAIARSAASASAPGRAGAPAIDTLVEQWREVDLAAGENAEGLLEGVDHVVTALSGAGREAGAWNIDFRANLALLQQAETSGVKSLVFVGSLGTYRSASEVQRAKFAFCEALRRSQVAGAIVHPSAFFRDIAGMVGQVRSGRIVQLGDGNKRMNPIHGADLAEFCLNHLGKRGEWRVGGPEVFHYRELYTLAEHVLGTSAKRITVPFGVLRAGAWVARRTGRGDVADFMTDMLTHDSVGERYGTHRVAEFFAEIAAKENS